MARDTYRIDDALHFGLWLIFNRNGDVRLTRRQPALDREERAVSMTAILPLALWSTPSLSATLKIDADAAPRIDMQVAAQAIREALGIDVDLRVNGAGQ